MKKQSFYTILIAAMTLVGCGSSQQPERKNIGMGNPASIYCVKVGGKSILMTNDDGSQNGECHLPDGRIVDEWELYRKAHK